jgi:hypothetical protein
MEKMNMYSAAIKVIKVIGEEGRMADPEYIILSWIAIKAMRLIGSWVIPRCIPSTDIYNCNLLSRRGLLTKEEEMMIFEMRELASYRDRRGKWKLYKDITKEYAYKCIEYCIDNKHENFKEERRAIMRACIDIVQGYYGSEKYILNK